MRQILAALPLAGGTLTGDLVVGNSSDLTVSGVTTLASTGVAATSERGDHVSPTPVGRIISINEGTVAAPVTAVGPLIKISKIEDISAVTQPNPSDSNSNTAVVVNVFGALTNEVQATAIRGFATGGGTGAGHDVCGVWGTGVVSNTGSTANAGNYLEGRLSVNTGRAYGLEARCHNGTATDFAYTVGSSSQAMGLWVTTTGDENSSGAVLVHTASVNSKWHVGFGIPGDSVIDQSFRDDSSSTTSIDINGTHTDGIDLTGATISGKAIRIPNNEAIAARNAANSADVDLLRLNASDRVEIAGTNVSVAGTTIAFGANPSTSGVIRLSNNSTINFRNAANSGDLGGIAFDTNDRAQVRGNVIAGAADLAFFGVTPVARPTAYTQTYATADRTHAAPTAATLTVTDGAGTNDNTIGAITADASVIAAVQELADEINKLVADVADTKQLVNSVIDDFQAFGLLQ